VITEHLLFSLLSGRGVILDQGVTSILSHVLFHIGETPPKPPAPLKLDLATTTGSQTTEEQDLSKAAVKEEVPDVVQAQEKQHQQQPTPPPAKTVPEQQQPAVAQTPAVAATNSTE